jgi:hypothetical protein
VYQILGAEAWEDMHSSPTTKKLFDAFNTSFTRGGVNIIRYFYPILERLDASVVTAWPFFLCTQLIGNEKIRTTFPVRRRDAADRILSPVGLFHP